ncbi:hypothetical protein EDD21DRAFT_174561 [Dissophora ornata]|nr:hypothetical protein EDD21DRAFT_174561 [Dissophora ornata]
MASSEVARWISTVLRGGSIVKSEDIEKVVDLMLGAVDMDGRKYILNALLSTKSTQILHTFMESRGPVIFRTWIAEARKDISSAQCEEILLKTIDVLMSLPFDVERLKDTQIGKAIKLLASDKRGSQELARKASELKDKWLKLISDDDSVSSPLPSTYTYENPRKRPRFDIPAAPAEIQQVE